MDPTPTAEPRPRLLIVDDDPLITDTLSYILATDFDVTVADNRAKGLATTRTSDRTVDLALVDLGLPPHPHRPDEGFALISELLALSPSTRIFVLSGQNDAANARHARTLGAVDFIAKPADPAQLRETLRRALSFDTAPPPPSLPLEPCRLLGESLPIQRLRAQVKQYADSPFPVLIEGESGSGKEIVASCCFHQMTLRHDKPYLALNCAAISPNLVEPTLFGYAKGAFTGAAGQKSGYFEDAGEGTLFLDEIGELPLDLQAKLLRVLENGEFQRVGETQTRISRARVIAATNRDLRKEVREGRFRADLYHRLSVFTVSVPPLREMGTDKLLLLNHFRHLYAQQTGAIPFSLDPQAENSWLSYAFTGNVRELRNIVIRLTAKYPGRQVSAIDLAAELDDPISVGSSDFAQNPDSLLETAKRNLEEHRDFNLDETLRAWEKAYIEAAQQLTHGNITQSARMLGLNRTTLYNRMETLARRPLSPNGEH